MPERIIVLGMFRSGTSLSTRLVQSWGAYAGRQGDLFEDRYGYLEHFGLQKLNDELLDHNDWLPPLPETLEKKSADPLYRERALHLLDQMDREAQQDGKVAWVWKDPRLPLVLPFWLKFWDDVVYVIPIRHPAEIVLSAANMDGMASEEVPLSAGLIYWQFCMLNVLTGTRDSLRKIFIDYEQMLRDPWQACILLCRFLDEQCDLDPTSAGARIEAMSSRIEAKQHHVREPKAFAEIELTTREQRALFDFLRVRTLCPQEPFNLSDFALYPGWQEYLQLMAMFLAASRKPGEVGE